MEIESQSSITLTKSTESSSPSAITSVDPPPSCDHHHHHHHQASDSINDKINSLSINGNKVKGDDDDSNNGVKIGDSLEGEKSVLDDGNNGVEVVDLVEKKESCLDDANNGVEIVDSVEKTRSVSDDSKNDVENVDLLEKEKSVSDDSNNGVEIVDSTGENLGKSVSDDGNNGVEVVDSTGENLEKSVSDDGNNSVEIGDWGEKMKGVSDDGNNGVAIIDWAEEVKDFSDDDDNNGDWGNEIKSASEIGEEGGNIEDEFKNEEIEIEFNRRKVRYPIRPDAEDCSFFLRTGACKFGMNCKFNHPPNQRKFQGVKMKAKEEFVDSATQKMKEKDEEQIDCKYFDRPGGCKYGKACKFNHSRKPTPVLKLNFMGLPIRMGEKECPFYMRNGSCKYGANCRFNHPDPTTIAVPDALARYGNGGSMFSPNNSQSTLAPWSPTALNENSSYVPLMFPPTQAVPSQPEWNPYQKAPVYPPERNIRMPSPYALNRQLLDKPEKMQGDEFPERPGQPECSYFLKTGDCKYKSACKFHHPKSVKVQSPSCTLSDSRLPLRPGENICSYYNRYGICKYGPACKYDHPINHVHSSELTVSVSQQ